LDNSDRYIEQGAIEKLIYTLECEKLNKIMAQHLVDSIHWIFYYCKKYSIPLPDKDKINKIVDVVIKLNDDFNQKFTPQDIHRRFDRTI